MSLAPFMSYSCYVDLGFEFFYNAIVTCNRYLGNSYAKIDVNSHGILHRQSIRNHDTILC